MNPREVEMLQSAQEAIVRALVLGTYVPPQWNKSRVEAAAHSLAHKRARAAAAIWPSLPEALGGDYYPRFIAWARRYPLLPENGARADGRRFIEWCSLAGDTWPDNVRIATAQHDLRWQSTKTGVARSWRPKFLMRLKRRGLIVGFGVFGRAISIGT